MIAAGRSPEGEANTTYAAELSSQGASMCSLTSRVGGTRSSRISSENQIKLERVYVWMPRHQEPTKDVAKLRNAPERRKQSLTRGCPRFGNDTV